MRVDCLIVDDEVMLSKNTVAYFEAFGVSAFHVEDKAGCLAFFREHEAELILLDINLGGDSGFDLCGE